MQTHGGASQFSFGLCRGEFVLITAARRAPDEMLFELDCLVIRQFAIELSGQQFAVVVARHNLVGRSAVVSSSRAAKLEG